MALTVGQECEEVVVVSNARMQRLDLKKVQESLLEGLTPSSHKEDVQAPHASTKASVSLEAEIPEVLYTEMKDFIGSNPNWDQYSLLSSALANFLFLNGCGDRAVTEKYLNDLFTRSEN